MSLFDQFRALFAKPRDAIEVEESFQNRRVRPRTNPREGTRILIIDDSQTIVTALKRVLQSAGCSPITALDAASGLKLVLSHHPELIFLDIVMPGINGFAALRALRRDERTKHIPIIMMSGNEQATEQFFGARIGADDFMKKPFSRHEIFARIEQLLDENQIPRRRPVVNPPAPADSVAAVPTSPSAAPVTQPHHQPINEHHQAAALLQRT
ncbi:MAG: response regulator [Zoogloeaceae bacterium]|nr:response regulator [Zoogloeaceae bacterium]